MAGNHEHHRSFLRTRSFIKVRHLENEEGGERKGTQGAATDDSLGSSGLAGRGAGGSGLGRAAAAVGTTVRAIGGAAAVGASLGGAGAVGGGAGSSAQGARAGHGSRRRVAGLRGIGTRGRSRATSLGGVGASSGSTSSSGGSRGAGLGTSSTAARSRGRAGVGAGSKSGSDDSGGIIVRASLGSAIADTPLVVVRLAQASQVPAGTAQFGSLVVHVVDTHLSAFADGDIGAHHAGSSQHSQRVESSSLHDDGICEAGSEESRRQDRR